MEDFFDSILGDVVIAVIILFIVAIVDRIIGKIIKNIVRKRSNKQLTTVLLFVKKVKTIILYILGILIALAQFEVMQSFSITLLSAIGVIAGILGLAAQETLSNFFGSLELVLNRPFEIGDFIKIPQLNLTGTVEAITNRHTVIRTINNQRDIIPNYELNSLAIENYDFSDNEIVLFADYTVAYKEDLEKVVNIMKEELEKVCSVDRKGYNKDVEFPKVRVISWEDSGIKLRAWIWGKDTTEAYDNLWEYNLQLKIRFDKEKIEIPYKYINIVSKTEKNTK